MARPHFKDGCANSDPIRERLARAIGSFDPGVPPAFAEAMGSFLTAFDYNDVTLMKAHLVTALTSMLDVVSEGIKKRVEWSRGARQEFEELASEVGFDLDTESDEVGRQVGIALDTVIRVLTDLRDGTVRVLTKHGIDVPDAPMLADEIEKMTEFKQSLVGGWPRSDREMPPADRRMAAESRAAFSRGEGVPIEDLIRRLEGEATDE